MSELKDTICAYGSWGIFGFVFCWWVFFKFWDQHSEIWSQSINMETIHVRALYPDTSVSSGYKLWPVFYSMENSSCCLEKMTECTAHSAKSSPPGLGTALGCSCRQSLTLELFCIPACDHTSCCIPAEEDCLGLQYRV